KPQCTVMCRPETDANERAPAERVASNGLRGRGTHSNVMCRPETDANERAPAERVASNGLRGRGTQSTSCVRVGGGAAPAEVALHELVEVAVEAGVDLARLDLGPQVLHHLVRLQHVRPDLAPPPDLGLLAGDRVELGLPLLFDLGGDHRLQP